MYPAALPRAQIGNSSLEMGESDPVLVMGTLENCREVQRLRVLCGSKKPTSDCRSGQGEKDRGSPSRVGGFW